MTERIECACDNCDWKGSTNDVEDIRDLWSRIEAGMIFPAGDCPECGAFAYMIEDKPALQRLVEAVDSYYAENITAKERVPTADDFNALCAIVDSYRESKR